MTITSLFNIDHGMAYGFIVVAFPFFTGLSAGSFVVSTLSYVFGQERYKPIARTSVVLAIILLFMALLTLFADMTQPANFYWAIFRINPYSMFSLAGILIGLYLLMSLIYGYFIFNDNAPKARIMGILSIPVALAVHADTGFVFGLNYGTPIWHTALMPVLFVVSAIVSGLALLIVLTVIKDRLFSVVADKETVYSLGKLLAAFILVDLFLIFTDLVTMAYSGQEEYDAMILLTKGQFVVPFVGIEIFLGALIPVLILVLAKKNLIGHFIAGVLVVIGVFAMRYNVVIAGQTISKTGTGLVEFTGLTPTSFGYSHTAEILVVIGIFALGVILFLASAKYLNLDVVPMQANEKTVTSTESGQGGK